MRRLILAALGVAMLLMTGCISKGPYYIYGDYIEELREEDLQGEETPVEQTSLEETPLEMEL